MKPTSAAPELLDRLSDRFLIGDGCWEWTAACQSRGYGVVSIGGTTHLAHRVMYELMVGPIPAGLTVDHLCGVKRCVRPDHLEAVTALENHRRWSSTVTRCKWGHEFTEANTWQRPDGGRMCKKCNAQRQRETYQRRRSQ